MLIISFEVLGLRNFAEVCLMRVSKDLGGNIKAFHLASVQDLKLSIHFHDTGNIGDFWGCKVLPASFKVKVIGDSF